MVLPFAYHGLAGSGSVAVPYRRRLGEDEDWRGRFDANGRSVAQGTRRIVSACAARPCRSICSLVEVHRNQFPRSSSRYGHRRFPWIDVLHLDLLDGHNDSHMSREANSGTWTRQRPPALSVSGGPLSAEAGSAAEASFGVAGGEIAELRDMRASPSKQWKQFFRALPISFLIVISIWTITMIFLLGLPSFSFAVVCKYDRVVVEELRRMATWMVVITGLCGAALGVCLPMAIRWIIQRRRERHVQNANV